MVMYGCICATLSLREYGRLNQRVVRKATLQGAKAVEAVLSEEAKTCSPLIGMNENEITLQPLMECVELVLVLI